MGRLLIALGLLASLPVAAHDFDFSADLRLVGASGQTSWLNGGLGKLRFDEDHDGLRLGQLRFAYRGNPTETLRFTAEAFAYGDDDVNAVDLTEIFLSWRPVPQSLWRSEVKLGAFYAPISLENRMRGWRSPYSLNFSAINSWVGEELRTIGLEYNLDWLGQQQGSPFNVGFTAAAYGWNDPAGIIVAMRGWAVHDRQTTLFGKVGQPGQGVIDGRTLFYDDIDGKVGYYAGLTATWRGVLEFRALRYDNHGDPTAEAPAIDDYAWHTVFDSYGLRWTPGDQWTVIAQVLTGNTAAGDVPPPNYWRFDSWFVLGSWQRGKHRLTLRYDDFSMRQLVSHFPGYNRDNGQAVTAAWLLQINDRWSAVIEGLRIDSELAARRRLGAPVAAEEQQWQLALRYDL